MRTRVTSDGRQVQGASFIAHNPIGTICHQPEIVKPKRPGGATTKLASFEARRVDLDEGVVVRCIGGSQHPHQHSCGLSHKVEAWTGCREPLVPDNTSRSIDDDAERSCGKNEVTR